jgi:ubiquinone/menaquinone biosynthesis C-methylase UbiE
MSFYNDAILPRLCHFAMRNPQLVPYRERAAGAAEGRVLEIGIGSGLNLPLYSSRVEEVLGLEPAPRLIDMARSAARDSAVSINLIEGTAEAIPVEGESIDTVVTTWTLCTIPDAEQALREMRRVLKANGHLLFVEHGLAPDESVRWWQHRLTPAWRYISGGCHLNRPIQSMIENVGFDIDRMKTSYMPGPKPMTFMYEGSARPK